MGCRRVAQLPSGRTAPPRTLWPDRARGIEIARRPVLSVAQRLQFCQSCPATPAHRITRGTDYSTVVVETKL
jgi:hypothetical protein